MTDARDKVRRQLRTTRFDPPALAGSDPRRRQRYAAALQQFEELLEAAAAVGPASRPLPLFYAAEQAGRAVAAARLTENGGQLQGGHGLTLSSVKLPLGKVLVAPKGYGSFQGACAATGSPLLTSPAELGALWGSLPAAFKAPLSGEHPRALLLIPEEQLGPAVVMHMTHTAIARVYGLPQQFAQESGRAELLAALFDAYPSAAGWESPSPNGVPGWWDPAVGWTARLQWRLPESTGSAQRRHDYLLNEVAPRSDLFSQGWLRPSVDDNGDTPSELMTWWLVLFCLSMLARYQPDQWLRALNVDKSSEAVTVETILDEGLEAVPRLVLGALLGEPQLSVG